LSDDLAARALRHAKEPAKFDTPSKTVDAKLRREWWHAFWPDGVLTEVYFCPPLALVEIREHFPFFRGVKMEPKL
jgi:hypothetical protein